MLGREIRVKPLFLTHSPQRKLLRVSGELHQILLVEKPYQTGLSWSKGLAIDHGSIRR